MGNLTSIFRQKNGVFLQTRHQNTNEWQKTKNNRIQKFLYFCESKNVKDMHQIKQKHFDEFLKNLIIAGESGETIRQYALAIKEFVARAHIKDIQINPQRAKKRKIKQKAEKIVAVLRENGIQIDDIVKTQIAKIL